MANTSIKNINFSHMPAGPSGNRVCDMEVSIRGIAFLIAHNLA